MRKRLSLAIILIIIISLSGCSFFRCPSKKKFRTTQKLPAMKPKIVQKEKMVVVGFQVRTSMNDTKKIPQLWQQFMKRSKEIENVKDENCHLGVSFDMEGDDENGKFTYMVASPVTSVAHIPERMKARKIPAHKYAIFTLKGPLDKLGQVYDYIYSKWAQDTEYEIDYRSDQFELYDERFKYGKPDSEIEIYIPIK